MLITNGATAHVNLGPHGVLGVRELMDPARSLFAHMPLDELVFTAVEKQKAVQEETQVLQADLEQMNQHRETLVESLLSVCEQAARLLHRAEKWSVLPDMAVEIGHELHVLARRHDWPARPAVRPERARTSTKTRHLALDGRFECGRGGMAHNLETRHKADHGSRKAPGG